MLSYSNTSAITELSKPLHGTTDRKKYHIQCGASIADHLKFTLRTFRVGVIGESNINWPLNNYLLVFSTKTMVLYLATSKVIYGILR